MEGWFPRERGEHRRRTIAMRRTCLRTQSSKRAVQESSTDARTEPRTSCLDSRPSSQNGSRRPDRRIWGERGCAPCDPTLWEACPSLPRSPRLDLTATHLCAIFGTRNHPTPHSRTRRQHSVVSDLMGARRRNQGASRSSSSCRSITTWVVPSRQRVLSRTQHFV
jgi:hypothetical protein